MNYRLIPHGAGSICPRRRSWSGSASRSLDGRRSWRVSWTTSCSPRRRPWGE
ncbi:MAG: hypothetical protein ACLRWQ_18455 [Flavonifractor plautii]